MKPGMRIIDVPADKERVINGINYAVVPQD
jgi:hypothetical protein